MRNHRKFLPAYSGSGGLSLDDDCKDFGKVAVLIHVVFQQYER
jgi:hypothetical protein